MSDDDQLLFFSCEYSSSQLLKDDLENKYSKIPSRYNVNGNLRPKIRLETLNASGTLSILLITYFAFAIALIYPYLQGEGYLSKEVEVSGAGCKHYPAQWNESCTRILNKSFIWSADISGISPLSNSLSLRLLSSEMLLPEKSKKFLINFNFQLIAVERSLTSNPITKVIMKRDSLKTWITCLSHRCESAPIIDIDGMEGLGYSEYLLIIQYIEDFHPYKILKQVDYSITYFNPLVHLIEVIIRSIFIVCTCFALIKWFLTFYCSASEPKTSFFYWLPERKWITFLGFFLLFWQNPVLCIAQWYNHVSFLTLFLARLSEKIAEILMLIVWLLMMDGFRQRNYSFFKFYLPKLIFGFVLLILAISNECLKLRLLLLVDKASTNNESIITAEVLIVIGAFSILFGMLFWICWMSLLIYRTGISIKKLHYLETRFQQLSYRFFLMQTFFIFFYLLVIYMIQLAEFFRAIHQQGFLPSITKRLTRFESTSNSFGVLSFFSIYIYLLMFLYSPPLSYNDNKGNFIFNSMIIHEKDEKKIQQNYPLNHLSLMTKSVYPLFCLEKAIWLLEIACQAYFDAPGQPSNCGYGEITLDLVGFELVASLRDLETDTYVLICKDNTRLVIAFRGSVSSQNWMTNLKAHQEPLWIRSRRRKQDVSSSCGDLLKSCVSKVPLAKQTYPRVHSGFWRAYSSVREDINEVVQLLIDDNSSLKIYATGHSMGGALAIFAAYDLAVNLQCHVTMYNFGAPRAGNAAFVSSYNTCVPDSFRVSVDGDFVTGIPHLWGMYKHVGIEVIIDGEDGVGNMLVDPSFLERQLQITSKRRLSVHSTRVYQESLIKCFEVALVAESTT